MFILCGSTLLLLALSVPTGTTRANVCPPNFGSSFDYDRCLAETQDFSCFRNDVATKFDFLDEKSVVVVIGAYKGENVERVALNNHHPNLVLFEPIREYAEILRHKFAHYPSAVDVYETAIGISNKTAYINLDSDASSVVADSTGGMTIINVATFHPYYSEIVERYGKIDLLYVNCEGCEYEFLTDILKHGWTENIDRLLLQFHYQADGYSKSRCPLLHILSGTHHRAFSYPWVWEMWVKTRIAPSTSRRVLDSARSIFAISRQHSLTTIVVVTMGIFGISRLLIRTRKRGKRRKAR